MVHRESLFIYLFIIIGLKTRQFKNSHSKVETTTLPIYNVHALLCSVLFFSFLPSNCIISSVIIAVHLYKNRFYHFPIQKLGFA